MSAAHDAPRAWRALQTARALLAAAFAIVLTIGAIRIAGFGVFDDFQQRVGAVVIASLVVLLAMPLFGALLEALGTGDALLRVAQRATARTRGGPAHAAIAASGLFGTLSGSTVANVVGTGVFTMPMIKRHGFSARFAGAVEAAASSGGQIMPPVMGAVAFIMADVTGIPYVQVALAALVPSLFYYASLFVYVAVKAGREGIQHAAQAPRVRISAQDWWLMTGFVIPLAVVVGVLVAGRSPAIGGFYATLAALVIGFAVSPPFRREPRRLLRAAVNAGRASAVLLVAVGAVGVIIGVMNMTGIGLKFANAVLSVSGENLSLALLLTMAACLVLGMGMPTVPAYLIIVLVMGPALSKMGISIVAAHLFAVYYAVLSVITPPVALAAFAAAPICGAPPFKVALESCKIAAVGFIIPYVFVYEPSLLIIDGVDAAGFAWAAFRLSLGLWLLTTGFEGWAFERLGRLERLMRSVAGVGLLIPEATSSIAALLLAAVVLRREGARAARALAGRKPA